MTERKEPSALPCSSVIPRSFGLSRPFGKNPQHKLIQSRLRNAACFPYLRLSNSQQVLTKLFLMSILYDAFQEGAL